MPEREPEPRMSNRMRLLVLLLVAVTALVALLVIESCDTEKVEICDVTTGKCQFESTCRPLLIDLGYGLFS